jgi:hypothetical protein
MNVYKDNAIHFLALAAGFLSKLGKLFQQQNFTPSFPSP